MKKCIGSAALAVAMLGGGSARAAAQSVLLDLPDVSQHARVSQRLGLTDITIDYHRPLVHGRKIFGGLQAYGKVWRAGADLNTTIQFSSPVTVEGQALPKGRYGLHMIPGETSWIVIFSKAAESWGSFTYDSAEDALRVTVTPRASELHEALSYDFGDPEPDSAVVTMRWEKVAVPFKVEVDTPAVVEESLRTQLRGLAQTQWQAWEEAANYLLEHTHDADAALKYADASIGVEDRFENEITKARALTALGRTDESRAVQEKALAMGTQQQVHSYARGLQGFGQLDRALEIFRSNIKKDPNSWIAHSERSRLAVAGHDFDAAVKEGKLAVAAAPDALKPQLADFVRQLENHVDINR